MKNRIGIVVGAFALGLASCGGGDEPSPIEALDADFDPPTLTGTQVCDMLPQPDLEIVMGAGAALASPSSLGSGCQYLFIDQNNEDNIGDVGILIENNGGVAGYDAYVAFWSERAEITALSGIGEGASLVENESLRTIVYYDGNLVVTLNGPASADFAFDAATAQRMAEVVDAVL